MGASTGPVSFTLTIRLKPGGVVTSALFAMAHQLGELRPELLGDMRPMQLNVPLVGITGDFTLPRDTDAYSFRHEGLSARAGTRKWSWVAGGIGVTSFLAMLAGLREKKSSRGDGDADDIALVLSTREPDMLLPLVVRALERTGNHLGEGHQGTLSIHVFSRSPASSPPSVNTTNRSVLAVEVTQHAGRLNEDTLRALDIPRMQERQALCVWTRGF